MAADRIRNGKWMGDLELKDDLTDYVKRNWQKKEILDFIQTKYPMYAWSERTLSRRLQYFDIKFTDYEVDVATGEEAVRRELEGLDNFSDIVQCNKSYGRFTVSVYLEILCTQ